MGYKKIFYILLPASIYGLILLGLFSPYSFGLSYGKISFAYSSVQSPEYNYRYETTLLGFQTIFGMVSFVIAILASIVLRSRSKNALANTIKLLITYLVLLLLAKFMNGFSGIGGPFGDRFLYGHYVLIGGTLALFLFVIVRQYQRTESKSHEETE